MKRQKVDILRLQGNKPTPEEKERKIQYYSELARLGLDIPFDNDDIEGKLNYSPFNSQGDYKLAQGEAIMYLMNYKPVPKDLETKLLIVKQNREKQSV